VVGFIDDNLPEALFDGFLAMVFVGIADLAYNAKSVSPVSPVDIGFDLFEAFSWGVAAGAFGNRVVDGGTALYAVLGMLQNFVTLIGNMEEAGDDLTKSTDGAFEVLISQLLLAITTAVTVMIDKVGLEHFARSLRLSPVQTDEIIGRALTTFTNPSKFAEAGRDLFLEVTKKAFKEAYDSGINLF
jgi:hypothetical protein